MADIDIEKRSSHGLLWSILGLAALGLLLFWLLRGANNDQVTMVEEPATEPVPTAPATVEPTPVSATQQYQQQCAQAPTAVAGTGSQHTSQCLNLLTTAVESSVPAGQLSSIQPQLDNARSAATQLGTAADPNTQTQLTKDAFTAVGTAFETLNPTGTGNDAAKQITETASQINADQPLSAQADVVQRFFTEASALLNQTPTTM
jgi:hypothetical protein